MKNSTKVLDVAPLSCPFIVVSNIFTLKRDIIKQHCDNAGLNIQNNASLAVYQAALARHYLVMSFTTESSLVNARLSKMEVAIKNIMSFVAVGNLVVNQLMEREAVVVVIAKAAST